MKYFQNIPEKYGAVVILRTGIEKSIVSDASIYINRIVVDGRLV